MGRTVTLPSCKRTRISGEDPTTWVPPTSRKYMYGDGFNARSARYTSTDLALNGTDSRWLSTTWNTSPARTYSCDYSTAAMNPTLQHPDTKSASSSDAG